MEGRKPLVLAISAIAIALFIGGTFYHHHFNAPVEESVRAIPINTEGSPTIGNPLSKIHIVVFEDFRCPHCAKFSEYFFPRIRAEYVKTGKARYTLIPVAFLPGSKVIANAALEVYATSPELFFPYAEQIFKQSPTTEKELIDLASEIKGINLESLKTCIKTKCQYQQLDQNLKEIIRVMGTKYSTPSKVNSYVLLA